MEWLTFAAGLVIGALGIAASVTIAWRQRVIQLCDRATDREQDRARELEHRQREAKIARREQWKPEYDAIRSHLDCGETLAYRILLRGPFTANELDALDIVTFRMNTEILADRGIEGLRDPLLALASHVDELARNPIPDEVALVAPHGKERSQNSPIARIPLRRAVLQDRAARELAEMIKAARRVLRAEWGE